MGEAKHYEFGNVDMSDALQDALDPITTKKEEANVILSSASLAMSSATPFSFDVHFPNLSLAITHIFPSGAASAGTSGYQRHIVLLSRITRHSFTPILPHGAAAKAVGGAESRGRQTRPTILFS